MPLLYNKKIHVALEVWNIILQCCIDGWSVILLAVFGFGLFSRKLSETLNFVRLQSYVVGTRFPCLLTWEYELWCVFLVFAPTDPEVLGYLNDMSKSDHTEWNQYWSSNVLVSHCRVNLFVLACTGYRLEFWIVSSPKFYDNYNYLSYELFLCGSKTSRGCQKLVLVKKAVRSSITNACSAEVQSSVPESFSRSQ